MAAGYHDGSTAPLVLPFYGQEAIGSVTIILVEIEDPAQGAQPPLLHPHSRVVPFTDN